MPYKVAKKITDLNQPLRTEKLRRLTTNINSPGKLCQNEVLSGIFLNWETFIHFFK